MKHIILLSVCLCVASLAFSQNPVNYSYDSAGNRVTKTVSFPITPPFPFGEHKSNNTIGETIFSNKSFQQDEKRYAYPGNAWEAHYDSLRLARTINLRNRGVKSPRLLPADSLNYSVGEIPLQEGRTLSGARTYQIPIITASGLKLIPSIAIGYNSQATDGWVGYGWDIQGVSKIALTNKSVYYHGVPKAADVYSLDAVFALDGVPLVTNTQSSTQSSFPLITATGNILAAPIYDNQGYVTSFTVKYPTGVSAVFGFGTEVGFNKPSYPIVQMTDMEGNRIVFTYSNDLTNENDRLDAIRYGYTASGSYNGEILLSYSSSPGYTVRHYAGKSICRSYRLTDVVSKSDSTVICQYALSYQQRDSSWFLSQVDCFSEGDSLRSLRFEYGPSEEEPYPTAGYLYEETPHILYSAFTSENIDYLYKRGKFVSGSYNDGIIIYPQFSNYDVTERHGILPWSYSYEFGSLYPANQRILVAPSLADYNYVDTTLTVGSGFQTMEAVDVDGDGLDELVKINFNGVNGSNTKLLITTYKYSSSFLPVQNSQFEVQVQGTVTSGDYISPYKREYYWGDFLGNGKVQLLTVAFDQNYNSGQNFSQISYAALIDLSMHYKVCDTQLFTFSDSRTILALDLDNDNQTELCHATTSGFNVYSVQGNNTFAIERTSATIVSSIFTSDSQPCYVTDLNGDGYIDILSSPSVSSNEYWTRYAFDGSDFRSSQLEICPRGANDEFMFLDLNQDNFADLVQINGTTLGTYINHNGASFGGYQLSPCSISNTKGIVPANIVDYCGSSCFIKIDGFYEHEYRYSILIPEVRQLTKSVDSFGKMTLNTYAFLPGEFPYWIDNTLTVDNSSGYSFRALPMYVLRSEEAYPSEYSYLNRYREKYYHYFNGVVHSRGLGFCGFSKVLTYDYSGNTLAGVTEEYFNPQKRGIKTSVLFHRTSVIDTPYMTVTNTYDNHSTTYGKLNPRLTESVTCDKLTDIETTTTYTYGSYNFPTTILTSRRIRVGEPQTESIEYAYEHSDVPSKYVLGVVKEESVIKEGDGDSTMSWKERTVNTYDNHYHLLTQKHYVGKFGWGPPDMTIPELGNDEPISPRGKPEARIQIDTLLRDFPVDTLHPIDPGIELVLYDATNLVSETRWQYDSIGNITSKMYAPYGATEFSGRTYTYDSEGRYMTTETDELGHTTSFSEWTKFGKPGIVCDYRNRSTYYLYDNWGNEVRKTLPDASVVQTDISWGGLGLYMVSHTATGSPDAITHYDALGRELRTEAKRFDGQWKCVDKRYDNKGRMSGITLPHCRDSVSYWNTYSYDAYNRLDTLVAASGKLSTWTYGRTNVTTVEEGISSTRTTDANGNTVNISDAGGVIKYTLRDDGQPASITYQDSVATTFAYDVYGRRIKMVDPSAGEQEDKYVWNSDGSSVFTHTNANGSVRTYRDKFGRKTFVERPGEFDTAYTYDCFGLLCEEQSTNGTGRKFEYDTLDRIVAVRDTIPQGKWLRKNFNYSAGSLLSSISYTSQSGFITTENYSYINGYNTGVTLSDNTIVWSLSNMNSLGLPTAVMSGGITREYGFSPFGLPVSRKMNNGNIQDFAYTFNVSKSTLVSRNDRVNNHTESFSYDNLNRLTSMGLRQISYADNGNILSIGGVGAMTYGSPGSVYQVTELTPTGNTNTSGSMQSISYTCYNRPSSISEIFNRANFTYNGNGERVRMDIIQQFDTLLTRYYLGGRYEYEKTQNGYKERLYVGGDAYSAPMVLQNENNQGWLAYNIGRDYLGSITHITTVSGTPVAEYSYDPWGRLRNPVTLMVYAAGSEPTLFLGRGFSGHEHLPWFGLINMNARLYDPLIGRFLSPDPLIQAPDFTQNHNRYSYALNNPLKFTDKDGKIILSMMFSGLTPFLLGFGNLGAHAERGDDWGGENGAKYFFSGFLAGLGADAFSRVTTSILASLAGVPFAGLVSRCVLANAGLYIPLNYAISIIGTIVASANLHEQGAINSGKIILGNFYLDENKSFGGQLWEGISRHSWEYLQHEYGYLWSNMRNYSDADRVDFLGGVTFVTDEKWKTVGYQGVTLGDYCNIDISTTIDSGKFDDYIKNTPLFMHEYGHTIDSGRYGPLYLFSIGIPSAISAANNHYVPGKTAWSHSYEPYEIQANVNASDYFGRNYDVDWSVFESRYPTHL